MNTSTTLGGVPLEATADDVLRTSRRRLVQDVTGLGCASAAVVALLVPGTYTSDDGLIVAAILLPIVLLGYLAVRMQAHLRLRRHFALDNELRYIGPIELHLSGAGVGDSLTVTVPSCRSELRCANTAEFRAAIGDGSRGRSRQVAEGIVIFNASSARLLLDGPAAGSPGVLVRPRVSAEGQRHVSAQSEELAAD